MQIGKVQAMKSSTRNRIVAAVLLAEGSIFGLAGLGIGHADDAPGAGLIGIVLFLAFAFAAFRTMRRPPPVGEAAETIDRTPAPWRDKHR
jgi:hypothetical protein